MTEHPDLLEAIAEQGNTGCGIFFQVFCRTHHDIAGRFAEAAVIVAKRGDALAGEIIRDDGERLVLKEFLVTILQTAASDHQQDRRRAVCVGRQRQGPFQYGIAVGERDFFCRIRERWLRRLGTLALRCAGRQGQRKRSAVLLKGAVDLVAETETFKGSADDRHIDMDGTERSQGSGRSYPFGPLVGNIQRTAFFGKVEHQRQGSSLYVEGARPRPRRKLCPAETAHQQQKKYKQIPFHTVKL